MTPIAKLWDMFKVLPLYVMPQHGLSRLVYRATRCTWYYWKNLLIVVFIRIYRVDMSIAMEPDHRNYKNFNDFFTRQLKDEVRLVTDDPVLIACPVDGSISRTGRIVDGNIIQAKGRSFTLAELLAGDGLTAGKFHGGCFATLYLSPKDYHRVHMPVDGGLLKMTCVPGRLFAVNPPSTRFIPRLFARNERIINLFSTDHGLMALVMVGALCVGSMETVWAGTVTPVTPCEISARDYETNETNLQKGQEMGRFNMGSSVILLFEPGRMEWLPDLTEGSQVKMGQALGRWIER